MTLRSTFWTLPCGANKKVIDIDGDQTQFSKKQCHIISKTLETASVLGGSRRVRHALLS